MISKFQNILALKCIISIFLLNSIINFEIPKTIFMNKVWQQHDKVLWQKTIEFPWFGMDKTRMVTLDEHCRITFPCSKSIEAANCRVTIRENRRGGFRRVPASAHGVRLHACAPLMPHMPIPAWAHAHTNIDAFAQTS